MKRAREAVRLELEKNKVLDIPITVYDAKRDKVIVKDSSGSEIAVIERIKKGRYSEWAPKENF